MTEVPDRPELDRTLANAWRKLRLAASTHDLGIPINEPFSRLVALPVAGTARVSLGHGLTATVLGPPLDLLSPSSLDTGTADRACAGAPSD